MRSGFFQKNPKVFRTKKFKRTEGYKMKPRDQTEKTAFEKQKNRIPKINSKTQKPSAPDEGNQKEFSKPFFPKIIRKNQKATFRSFKK